MSFFAFFYLFVSQRQVGLPAESGPCAQCPGCGSIRTLCECHAA